MVAHQQWSLALSQGILLRGSFCDLHLWFPVSVFRAQWSRCGWEVYGKAVMKYLFQAHGCSLGSVFLEIQRAQRTSCLSRTVFCTDQSNMPCVNDVMPYSHQTGV